ncbi:MAG: PD-(D/E)XK nuclease family protein, partial [Bdellovibrionota bacterium]
ATHLSGEAGTPHPIWIEYAKEKTLSPSPPIMQSMWNAWQSEWDEAELREQMSQTLKELTLPKEIVLSPSSVRDLLECPYIYVARKVFNLEDPDWVDVETPASEWGQLQHSLLERILQQDLSYWSEELLSPIVDELLLERQLVVSDKPLLKPLREKLIRLGLRFIEVEKLWKKQNPGILKQEFEKKWTRELPTEG